MADNFADSAKRINAALSRERAEDRRMATAGIPAVSPPNPPAHDVTPSAPSTDSDTLTTLARTPQPHPPQPTNSTEYFTSDQESDGSSTVSESAKLAPQPAGPTPEQQVDSQIMPVEREWSAPNGPEPQQLSSDPVASEPTVQEPTAPVDNPFSSSTVPSDPDVFNDPRPTTTTEAISPAPEASTAPEVEEPQAADAWAGGAAGYDPPAGEVAKTSAAGNSRKVGLLLAGLGAVVVLGVGGWLATRSGDNSDRGDNGSEEAQSPTTASTEEPEADEQVQAEESEADQATPAVEAEEDEASSDDGSVASEVQDPEQSSESEQNSAGDADSAQESAPEADEEPTLDAETGTEVAPDAEPQPKADDEPKADNEPKADATKQQAGLPREARVISELSRPVKTYREPSLSSDAVGVLNIGNQVTATERDGGWFKVESNGGENAWVFGAYILPAGNGLTPYISIDGRPLEPTTPAGNPLSGRYKGGKYAFGLADAVDGQVEIFLPSGNRAVVSADAVRPITR